MNPVVVSLRSLTSLRFFAALAVALSHLWYIGPSLPKIPKRIIAEGPAGVSFFFILSGFILAYNYRERFRTLSLKLLVPYYVARFARIWPAHLFVLGLVVLFPYIPAPTETEREYWIRLAAHVALLQSWVPDPTFAGQFNGVAWTLSVEVFFYFCLPGLLWLAARRPNTRPRTFLILALLVCVAECLYAYFGSAKTFKLGVWLTEILPPGRTLEFGSMIFPPGRIFEFVVGMLTGLIFSQQKAAGLPGNRRFITNLEVTVLIVLAVQAGFAHKVNFLIRANGYYTPIMAAIIYIFAHERGGISRLLTHRVFVFLGEVSYSFYLLHCLLIFHMYHLVVDPTESGWGTIPKFGLALGSLLITVLASAGVYLGIERPARSWIVNRFRKPGSNPRRPNEVVTCTPSVTQHPPIGH